MHANAIIFERAWSSPAPSPAAASGTRYRPNDGQSGAGSGAGLVLFSGRCVAPPDSLGPTRVPDRRALDITSRAALHGPPMHHRRCPGSLPHIRALQQPDRALTPPHAIRSRAPGIDRRALERSVLVRDARMHHTPLLARVWPDIASCCTTCVAQLRADESAPPASRCFCARSRRMAPAHALPRTLPTLQHADNGLHTCVHSCSTDTQGYLRGV